MSFPKIITFGCRLNACESDLIKDFMEELGIKDFILINTCAVTAEAERKLRQTIRRLYNEDREVKIILTGCASELNPDFYLKMNGIVGIISNKTKLSKLEYSKYATNESLRRNTPSQKIRGFLRIQNGCDHKCTYCVVRLTRGNNVSFHEDEIVNQAKLLLRKGYKEIVLTGVNVSSYGQDIDSSKNLAFIIRYLLKEVPEITRLRLSSLDPADINVDLKKVITSEEKLMPHFHESIQSGDDIILKRMMRRHSSQQVIETNQEILQGRPDIILGADIIVGFPTETDQMFFNTKKLLSNANITLLHVFPFSPRAGTSAALMPAVERKVILSRSKELKGTATDILSKKLHEFVGKNLPAIAETQYRARTNSFLSIKSAAKLIIGNEYLFQCNSIDKTTIIGQPINEA
ncbi:MAG: tRNA (N(6)-L-threonylcarbamoyladenosine(37)-C(2))-methylthiotransferase MtaB [Holosporaceae bacterium]|jgi:threonylcarbamoyladenosine tRNA methylthiotransferase MtaB|nr:tRNA (N(6)-L-threonylcarbamoyladenosine(37)-C(2))-methylthiotransferase MtaB [Holosporaceae bacterium]